MILEVFSTLGILWDGTNQRGTEFHSHLDSGGIISCTWGLARIRSLPGLQSAQFDSPVVWQGDAGANQQNRPRADNFPVHITPVTRLSSLLLTSSEKTNLKKEIHCTSWICPDGMFWCLWCSLKHHCRIGGRCFQQNSHPSFESSYISKCSDLVLD